MGTDTPADAGSRTIPHTGDLAIEAWAPDREECLAQALRGAVAAFAEIPPGLPRTARRTELTAGDDAHLLVAALEEVIYRMDTTGEIPADVRVSPTASGPGPGEAVRLDLAMVDTSEVAQVGPVPKAVSWHALHLGRGPTGWTCRVTLDV
ncbi:archease [Kitasatospora cinereorecta]|uniref:Archease n=1 Tax=Kitasatospora cinereorecta TaxID=285560 RepID=A0ABW0VM72_9ACTN